MNVYRKIQEDNLIKEIVICNIPEATYSGKDMGERAITATLQHWEVIDFQIGDYLKVDMADLSGGHAEELFYLYTLPTIKKIARAGSVMNAFEHTITFRPAQFELSTTQMRDVMQQNSVEDITAKNFVYTGYDEFSFFGGAHLLMRRIKYVLDERFGTDGVAGIDHWDYMIAEAVDEDINNALENVQFDFSGNSVWDALTKLTDEEGLNTDFYIVGRMIYVGYKRPHIVGVDRNNIQQSEPFNFMYGKTSHLPIDTPHGNIFNITKSIGTASPITRLYAYGASQNLNRFYASDRLRSGRYVNRLMLPSFNNDGKTDWLDSVDSIKKFGVREASKTFEDIYPTLRYMTYGDLRTIKYVVMVEGSGLNGKKEDPTIPLNRIQCYRVDFDDNGVAKLIESYPPSKLAVFVHATGKVVKCILYTNQSDQSAADFGNLPRDSSGKVIQGSCFCVHDSGYEDYLNSQSTRKDWFANIDKLPADTDDQKEYRHEVELHQIEYTDDYWMTDVFEFDDENPYDNQAFFPREGYSAYCYPHIGKTYNNGSEQDDNLLINEVVAVEPVTIVDTDMNKADGTCQSTFVVYLRDFGFMIDEQAHSGQYQWLVNGEFQLNFLDGYMAGLNFSVTANGNGVLAAYRKDGSFNDDWFLDGVDKTIAQQALDNGAFWRLICKRNTDNDYAWMPNTILNPQAGDHIVFLNIYMPDIYILAAEQRLLREAQKYLNDNDNGDISYTLEFDKVRLAQIPAFGLQMREGAVMRIIDEDLQIYTENEEIYLCNYANGLRAQMELTADVELTEYVTSSGFNNYASFGAKMSAQFPIPQEHYRKLYSKQPLFIKCGDNIVYPEFDARNIVYSGGTITIPYTNQLIVYGKRCSYGYITSNAKTIGVSQFLPFKQIFDIRPNKHYTVVLDVQYKNEYDDDNNYTNVIGNVEFPIILMSGLGSSKSYFYPKITNVSYGKTGLSAATYKRVTLEFDTPSNFNDRISYYLAVGFKTWTESMIVSAYLYSIKQSNTDENGEYAKFVDLTIDQLTIRMSDAGNTYVIGNSGRSVRASESGSNSGKVQKDITATVKERQKATAWTAMSNAIKDTTMVSERNTKNAEQLANQARRHYRELESLKNNIFDPDGSIKDAFLQTMLLQVGANSMNFTLDNTKVFNGIFRNIDFGVDSIGQWSIHIGKDILRHYVYTEGAQGGTWSISGMNTPILLEDEVYYISCKCQRDGNSGEWVIDTKQHAVDEENDYWYFNYGIINVANGGRRDLTETRGNVFVYGDNINAGKIMTFDGDSYFDLSGNAFKLGDQLFYKNGVLTIGKGAGTGGGQTIEQIIASAAGTPGGENLYIGGDVSSNCKVTGDIVFILLGSLEAGKKYIATYQEQRITPSGIDGFENTCIVVSQGMPYGDLYNWETEYDWNIPFEVNGNGRSAYIALALKDLITDARVSQRTYLYPRDIEYTIKGIMLQEGERATGYQAATKHITDAIENGSTE
ncbi:MAG: hypothetical protein NC083_09130, partial [Muribaculum sp.]|nr:hypothetical protein [Muribaculum sp.]